MKTIKKIFYENTIVDPPPEKLAFLGIIIIFLLFLWRLSSGLLWGGRWDGWQEARGGLLRKTQKKKQRKEEGKKEGEGGRIAEGVFLQAGHRDQWEGRRRRRQRSFLWAGGWRDIFWEINRGALDLAGRGDRGWR